MPSASLRLRPTPIASTRAFERLECGGVEAAADAAPSGAELSIAAPRRSKRRRLQLCEPHHDAFEPGDGDVDCGVINLERP